MRQFALRLFSAGYRVCQSSEFGAESVTRNAGWTWRPGRRVGECESGIGRFILRCHLGSGRSCTASSRRSSEAVNTHESSAEGRLPWRRASQSGRMGAQSVCAIFRKAESRKQSRMPDHRSGLCGPRSESLSCESCQVWGPLVIHCHHRGLALGLASAPGRCALGTYDVWMQSIRHSGAGACLPICSTRLTTLRASLGTCRSSSPASVGSGLGLRDWAPTAACLSAVSAKIWGNRLNRSPHAE